MKRMLIVILLVGLVLALWSALPSAQQDRPAPAATPGADPDMAQAAPPTPQPSFRPVPAGQFELPIEGATGYATIQLNVRDGPSPTAKQVGVVAAGTGFQIQGEEGDYWRVTGPGIDGYVAHKYCMVNLPDVIPSIVYDNTNAYGALLASSGKALPGVTGQKLYDNMAYNERLGQDQFIMPVLYEMAKKVCVAQQAALQKGDALKIYEAYRPYQVQRRVVNALSALSAQDAQVKAGISAAPWQVSWFVAQGTSYHQRGCAIDVSLVKADQLEGRRCGEYEYTVVARYEEYGMPTAMHELSIAAAAFAQPVTSSSATAWKSAQPASSMTQAAKSLQKILTDAGLTPLASEWWHFNDLTAYEHIKNNAGQGETVLTHVYSAIPNA